MSKKSAGIFKFLLVINFLLLPLSNSLWAQTAEFEKSLEQYIDYKNQSDVPNAIRIGTKLLTDIEKKSGENSSIYTTMLIDIATLYAKQKRYTEAANRYQKALAIFENIHGPETPPFAKSITEIANAYELIGFNEKAEDLRKRAIKILAGTDHPELVRTLLSLSLLYLKQRRFSKVEDLLNQVFRLLNNDDKPGGNFTLYEKSLLLLGISYRLQNRFFEAEKHYQKALKITEKHAGKKETYALILSFLGQLYLIQERYVDAEAVFTEALPINEGILGLRSKMSAINLNDLAEALKGQKRYVDAEGFYKKSLKIQRKVNISNLGTTLGNLGALYLEQGRYKDAKKYFEEAYEISTTVRGKKHDDVAMALNNLALLHMMQNRYDVAKGLYEQSLQIMGNTESPAVAVVLTNLGILYHLEGQLPALLGDPSLALKAERVIKKAIVYKEKNFGKAHLSVAQSLDLLAGVYSDLKKNSTALSLIRRATNIRRSSIFRKNRGILDKNVLPSFSRHLRLAYENSLLTPAKMSEFQAEAFKVGQLASRNSAASALTATVARLGASDLLVAKLIRRRQDLLTGARFIEKDLIKELSKPIDKRNTKLAISLRNKLRETEVNFDHLGKKIDENFPKYAELMNPYPLKSEEVRALLGDGEALLFYSSSYVWIIRRNEFRMVKLDISAKELTELVSKVRSSFVPEGGLVPPFPYSYAHDLYQEIFAPIEKDLTGIKHIMVVPDGPLTGLPLSVLLSSPYEGKGKPAWLAEKYALTTLPSVSSLRALRVLAKKAGPGSDPFAGFGNPELKGDPLNRRGISIARIFNKGDKADTDELRKLAALPETADELRMIARSLGASKGSIYLGKKATETKVKSLDLSKTKVIAFATHGLIAGELQGFSQPGLVLSPPANATRNDDGVLTASEIAQLKLHHGLVILSACNTAAADGTPGAEGLSGLAKAFFYAGSQSLLVSHWAVPSQAAKRLTTGMFTNLKKNPKLGWSEALRRSMMTLAANDNFSHPIHWAPFSLVGEGAVSR